MEYPLARAAHPDLDVVDSSASTNTELSRRAAESRLEWFTSILTEDQTAGRGRLGRSWVAPRGASLALSTLVPAERGGWIPLAAGLAMVEALDPELRDRVALKWPNDVLVDGAKICGILAEWTPAGVVVGAGLNTSMTTEQLPVPTATSLRVADVDPVVADAVVARYLANLRRHLEATPEELRAAVAARLATIGRAVHVELPGGAALDGVATGLGVDGSLSVSVPNRGTVAVAAGDVVHVR